MLCSITHSQYGGLVNRPTEALVKDYRSFAERVKEVRECRHFHDAYAYECARNDANDYSKRMRDLAAELNARFISPEASLRVTRDFEIEARIRKQYSRKVA